MAVLVLAACSAVAGEATACVRLVSGPATATEPAGDLRKCVDGTYTDAQFLAAEGVRPTEIYEVSAARASGGAAPSCH